jgi:hypothetical protein
MASRATVLERRGVCQATAAPVVATWYGIDEDGDAISGRRLLMWNDDVEISLCRPAEPMAGFYRNGEGDEVVFVQEGSGTLETIFGDVPYPGRSATSA